MGAITKITNGESGATVASRLWAVNSFDYVVETQSDMDSLGSYTGSAYKRVLIKSGSYTSDNALSYTNIGWERVVFELGASIEFVKYIDPGYYLEGSRTSTIFYNPTVAIKVGAGPGDTVLIHNALGVYDGGATFFILDSDDTVTASIYKNCDNMVNPKAIFDRSLDTGVTGVAPYVCFELCNNAIFPNASASGGGGVSDITGFNNCSKIVSPITSGLDTNYFSTTGVLADTTLA